MGGWVGWIEQEQAVGMRCCGLWVGGWESTYLRRKEIDGFRGGGVQAHVLFEGAQGECQRSFLAAETELLDED